jgi:hypothetical protein
MRINLSFGQIALEISEGSPQLSDLQTKGICSNHEELNLQRPFIFKMEQQEDCKYDCDLGFEDPVAVLLESYLSDSLKFSYFIISLALVGENDFLKEFLWLRLCFCYYLLISGRKGILSVMKLLVWLHWKHDFT